MSSICPFSVCLGLNRARLAVCLTITVLAPVSTASAGGQLQVRHQLSVGDGLPSSDLSCVLRDRFGFLWIGTDNGLARFDGHRVVILHHDPYDVRSLSSDRVRALYEDRSGHLWVGTDSGLDRLDREMLIVRRYSAAESRSETAGDRRISAMVEDGAGRLWVGTLGGLYLFDPGARSFAAVAELASADVRALVLDGDGRLWVGTQKGLSVISPGKGPVRPAVAVDLAGLERRGVTALALGPSGRLWIGTESGVMAVETASGKSLSLAVGAPISGLVAGPDLIWAGSSEALLATSVMPSLVGPRLVGEAVGPPVLWLAGDRSRLMWAATDRGLLGFETAPAPEEAVQAAPKVTLTRLTIEGRAMTPRARGEVPILEQDISFSTSLELPAESRMVAFDLATLDLESRSPVRYAFRLKGLHESWQETGGDRPRAIYSLLPPGDYLLEARAAWDGGSWGEVRQLAITVAPPRGRLRALVAYSIAALAAIFFLVRFRVSRARRDRALNLRLRELQEQKLESLSTLAGGVAHDFNNLLVGILGHAELAKMAVGEAPVRAHLERIVASARRAAELAKQMLFYSGRGNFVIEPLDVSALVREVGDSVRPNLPASVRLLVEPHPRLPKIEGDPGQLRQVITNLVTNASEALVDREGFIVLSTRVMTLDESFLEANHLSDKLAAGEYVVVAVDDTGRGIEEDALEKIFDPFFSTKSAGRGLGLAAAQGIARGHGGVLRVASTPGRGSTFHVMLPIMAEAESDSEPALDAMLEGRGRVLVVDADRSVRRVVRGYLEKLGFDVLEASDKASALAVLAHFRDSFALVILEVSAGGDGLETLRQLRLLEPALPVVLAGSLPASEAALQYSEHQPAGYLEKPFRLAHLQRVVRENVPAAAVN